MVTFWKKRVMEKMTPETNRILGFVGALLMFIVVIPVPYIGVVSFIGFILVAIALYGFSRQYSEGRIFSNFLYSILVAVVGGAVAVAVAFATFLTTLTTLLYKLYPGWHGDWMSIPSTTPDLSAITPADVMPLIGGVLAILVVVWVAMIISAFFARRSLNALSAKSNVHLFSTAGLLLLIGAIIPVVGLVLVWVSLLLVAIAFYQMRVQPAPFAPATAAPAQPPPPA